MKGYFGLGPGKCQEGDLIVVLAGGNVPYILRPVSPACRSSMIARGFAEILQEEAQLCNDWYKILGDSYVHGIMDGEVFELLDENGRQLKDIILI